MISATCPYHPEAKAEFECARCHRRFCSNCVEDLDALGIKIEKDISGRYCCEVCQKQLEASKRRVFVKILVKILVAILLAAHKLLLLIAYLMPFYTTQPPLLEHLRAMGLVEYGKRGPSGTYGLKSTIRLGAWVTTRYRRG